MSNSIVEKILVLIQILFGFFFSVRFGWNGHKEYKKKVAKSIIWMILYLCLFSFAKRLFYPFLRRKPRPTQSGGDECGIKNQYQV